MEYKIADIRREFSKKKLKPELLHKNPVKQFENWLNEAINAEVNEPTAMCMASVGSDGQPSTRVLLLKGIESDQFIFYTNYNSQKSRELKNNSKSALNFYWPELERQVNIQGVIEKTDEKTSDAYFKSRPYKSRIGAWASPQSEPIPSRNFIKLEFAKYAAKYIGQEVPRPPHWGGYALNPKSIIFWQGRPNRLHDRVRYSIQKDGNWIMERLAP